MEYKENLLRPTGTSETAGKAIDALIDLSYKLNQSKLVQESIPFSELTNTPNRQLVYPTSRPEIRDVRIIRGETSTYITVFPTEDTKQGYVLMGTPMNMVADDVLVVRYFTSKNLELTEDLEADLNNVRDQLAEAERKLEANEARDLELQKALALAIKRMDEGGVPQYTPPAPVPTVPAVLKVSLVKAGVLHTDPTLEIQEITEGAALDIKTRPTLGWAVHSISNDLTKSVSFNMEGPSAHAQIENALPHALKGDTNGKSFLWECVVGTYKLTITPYSQTKALGTAGTPKVINFTVVDTTPTPEPPPPAPVTNQKLYLSSGGNRFSANLFAEFAKDTSGFLGNKDLKVFTQGMILKDNGERSDSYVGADGIYRRGIIERNLDASIPDKDYSGYVLVDIENRDYKVLRGDYGDVPGSVNFVASEAKFIDWLKEFKRHRKYIKVVPYNFPFRSSSSDPAHSWNYNLNKMTGLMPYIDALNPSMYIVNPDEVRSTGHIGNIENYIYNNLKTALRLSETHNKEVVAFFWTRIHTGVKSIDPSTGTSYAGKLQTEKAVADFLNAMYAYRYNGRGVNSVGMWEASDMYQSVYKSVGDWAAGIIKDVPSYDKYMMNIANKVKTFVQSGQPFVSSYAPGGGDGGDTGGPLD